MSGITKKLPPSIAHLVVASDGLPARPIGAWSKEKLHYVRRYFTIFNAGMQKKWLHRIYIDLFSGPGRCLVEGTGEEIDGSPVLAGKCDPPFTRLFLNDLDPIAAGALRQRMRGVGGVADGPLQLDCNEAAADISAALSAIPSRSVLSLCFVDPTNWQIRFSSLAGLTKDQRMDLIVVFHSASMKRAADYTPAALTEFFGDDRLNPEWRQLYDAAARERQSRSRALLDHYENRLRGIGYVWIRDDIDVELDNDGLPLYQMVFASKHVRGEDFWRKITGVRHDGQRRMQFI